MRSLICLCGLGLKLSSWFAFVSGDSIPAKPPAFFEKLNFTGSVTAAQEWDENLQAGALPTTHCGSQWTLKTKQDTKDLARHWLDVREKWRTEHARRRCKCGNTSDCPEEMYLHTILHTDLEVPVHHPGICVMEQELEASIYPCGCFLKSGERQMDHHAKLWEKESEEFSYLLNQAKEDKTTLWLRKVGAYVGQEYLERQLGLRV